MLQFAPSTEPINRRQCCKAVLHPLLPAAALCTTLASRSALAGTLAACTASLGLIRASGCIGRQQRAAGPMVAAAPVAAAAAAAAAAVPPGALPPKLLTVSDPACRNGLACIDRHAQRCYSVDDWPARCACVATTLLPASSLLGLATTQSPCQLVIPHIGGKLLLGKKLRGFGEGYVNGFGGKVGGVT